MLLQRPVHPFPAPPRLLYPSPAPALVFYLIIYLFHFDVSGLLFSTLYVYALNQFYVPDMYGISYCILYCLLL